MRRIMQIAIANVPEIASYREGFNLLYAVCEDGTLWTTMLENSGRGTGWMQIEGPPNPE